MVYLLKMVIFHGYFKTRDVTMKTRGLMGKQPTNMVILMGFVYVMWVKHCHKPPMTGNIWEWFIPYTTYKNGDDWGMCFFKSALFMCLIW